MLDQFSITPFAREDLEAVLTIESESFDFPWSKLDFERSLEGGNAMGLVAEIKRRFRSPIVIGYAVFKCHRNRIDLWNLAVDRDFRRRRVGAALLQRIMSQLRHNGPDRLRFDVRESNLGAQLFLRECGFRCMATLPRMWAETDDDAYRFVYRLPTFDPRYADMACSGM